MEIKLKKKKTYIFIYIYIDIYIHTRFWSLFEGGIKFKVLTCFCNYFLHCVQDVTPGSSAVERADVSLEAGTVMEHQTVWMTLMNMTAVSLQPEVQSTKIPKIKQNKI